ncbi:DUF4238 domain-containing protein [Christiangramia forsetii]|uniref:DUF4238 domain-containing protein n=2 Tax=Christiangramia forsetii TaxID=411153 RepID=A0LZS5_CHRFK|nr:DUF4238 domain-containing protein [Christiangramia forsetii]GGG46639.1 hypothetical protein GCM10011532_33180 [Christiangramia forsetii]CAL65870.1 hypothetical protein GFO_0896 [Christiangramia forsetii KT0803]
MPDLKKRQHYVWKNYLKPWSTNDKICCLRNGKEIITSLRNIGQTRYFYKAEKLSEKDLNFLKGFIKNANPKRQEGLLKILDLYIKFSEGDEYSVKCGIEDLHCIIETRGIKLLNKLYEEDLSFFENEKDRRTFSFYLSAQFTRTKKMRENVSKISFNTPDLDNDKLARVFHLFFIEIKSFWIFHKTKLQLLINNSEVDFITGDQPIINALGNTEYDKEHEGYDLYYPISPKYAIYVSEKYEGKKEVLENEVKKFNKLIVAHSEEQIYSKEMSTLLSIN